jgi:NhaP-type Na+/H+ and K+/H+ antiporter
MRTVVLTATYVIVLISVMVQGGTIGRLLTRLSPADRGPA